MRLKMFRVFQTLVVLTFKILLVNTCFLTFFKKKKNLTLMLQFCSPELTTYKHLKNIFPLRNIIMKELCVDLIAFTMPIYSPS